MNRASKKIIREIKSQKLATDRFESQSDFEQLDMEWSAILKHYYNASNAMIRLAEKFSETRGWSHRTSRERKNNPILNYLLHCRNADDHQDEVISVSEPRTVRIGSDALRLRGQGSGVTFKNALVTDNDGRRHLLNTRDPVGRKGITFKNIVVGGPNAHFKELHWNLDGNKETAIESEIATTAAVDVLNEEFSLLKVRNLQEEIINVPRDALSRHPDFETSDDKDVANRFARLAMDWIWTKHAELLDMLKTVAD